MRERERINTRINTANTHFLSDDEWPFSPMKLSFEKRRFETFQQKIKFEKKQSKCFYKCLVHIHRESSIQLIKHFFEEKGFWRKCFFFFRE